MATDTKERPIVLREWEVRAIRDGRLTLLVRPVEPQPKHRLIEGLGHVTIGMDPADDGAAWYDADCINPGREVRHPFGRPGDRLIGPDGLVLVNAGVRVGRVQEMSEEDAAACGCDGDCPVGYVPAYQAGPLRYHHAWLYQQDHGDGAWDRNDWVWLISVRAAEGGAA